MFLRTKKFREEFKIIKPEIFRRDHWECQYKIEGKCYGCLDVHHIKGRKDVDSNNEKWLILLCRGSHEVIEGMTEKKSIPLLTKILTKKYGYQY